MAVDRGRVPPAQRGRRRAPGGHHSARLLVWSVDFAEVEALQVAGDWDAAGALLADAGSRHVYRRAAADLVDRGAEALIAGCTEIELLLSAEDVGVAYVPTTSAHVQAGAAWLLDGTLPIAP